MDKAIIKVTAEAEFDVNLEEMYDINSIINDFTDDQYFLRGIKRDSTAECKAHAVKLKNIEYKFKKYGVVVLTDKHYYWVQFNAGNAAEEPTHLRLQHCDPKKAYDKDPTEWMPIQNDGMIKLTESVSFHVSKIRKI